MTPGMTTSAEPPSGAEEGPSSEGELPRTCAEVSLDDESWLSIAGFLELIPSLAASALAAIELAPDKHAISIALMSDAGIRTLNRAFRGKDMPTNVLSFPSPPISRIAAGRQPDPLFLGDVALAYETVVREASELEKPALHHAAHLTVHGILHLAGFDHGGDADAKRMEATERLVLSKFGIPDPYGEDTAPPAASL